jgi:excisionase family DNA binding protein
MDILETLDSPTVNAQVEAPFIKLLLTPDEAATALGIKRTFLYHLLTSGQLYSVKVGRTRRVPLIALQEYVAHLCATQKAG